MRIHTHPQPHCIVRTDWKGSKARCSLHKRLHMIGCSKARSCQASSEPHLVCAVQGKRWTYCRHSLRSHRHRRTARLRSRCHRTQLHVHITWLVHWCYCMPQLFYACSSCNDNRIVKSGRMSKLTIRALACGASCIALFEKTGLATELVVFSANGCAKSSKIDE